MKKIVLLIVALLLFFVESILFTKLQINGITIPLTMIFGLSVAVVSDEWDAMFIGVVIGFFQDIYSPRLYGLNMFLNLWIFFFACTISRRLRRDKNILMALLMTVAALVKYVAYIAIMKVFGVSTIISPLLIILLSVFIIGIFMMIFVRLLFESSWIKVWNK